jgi:hypothetical protein
LNAPAAIERLPLSSSTITVKSHCPYSVQLALSHAAITTIPPSVIGHGIGGKHIPIMAHLAKGQTLE